MKTPSELMHDASFRRLLVYAGVACFVFFFGALTTCTMHMNSYNEGEEKAALAQIQADLKAELELQQQKHAEEMEKVQAIQKLVEETGVNPIAAKCAIDGFGENDDEREICERAASNQPIIVNTLRESND